MCILHIFAFLSNLFEGCNTKFMNGNFEEESVLTEVAKKELAYFMNKIGQFQWLPSAGQTGTGRGSEALSASSTQHPVQSNQVVEPRKPYADQVLLGAVQRALRVKHIQVAVDPSFVSGL